MHLNIFDLELASSCNARCTFCPQHWHGVKRDSKFMDETVLDTITAQIVRIAQERTTQVVFCGMGENLLGKPLVLRALRNLQKKPGPPILATLVSNGALLTAELLEYAEFRSLNSIQVSISGYNKEQYEEIYGLRYERVVENVSRMAAAMPGKVNIRTVALQKLGHGRLQADFVELWNKRGVEVSFRPMHSRGGHVADPEAYPGSFRQFKGCEIFNAITFVSSDGNVLPCCHDVLSEHAIGDCHTSTLRKIAAEKRTLQQSAFRGYPICSKCTDFELSPRMWADDNSIA